MDLGQEIVVSGICSCQFRLAWISQSDGYARVKIYLYHSGGSIFRKIKICIASYEYDANPYGGLMVY